MNDVHPKNLSIKDFTYELPEDKIAKYPLPKRDESRLLVYKSGNIEEDIYKDLDIHLPENSLLIFNNTKVVAARLLFTKSTGGVIEIFCLEPHERYADITTAMLQKGKVWWKCLVGGAKKWKEELLIKVIGNEKHDLKIEARKVEKLSDCFVIEFSWNDNNATFAEVLHHAGLIPLPPYLNRDASEEDKATYQTIYAKHDGSVAAPTAGLHFTDDLFAKLEAKKIQHDFVTLHVGAGTFKPVKAATMQEHEMHAEFIDVRIELIEKLLTNLENNIIAVGTTSLRTIESLYWMGVKAGERLNVKGERKMTDDGSELTIHQWDAYELPQNINANKALGAIIEWMKANDLTRLITKTQIIIAPGYQLRVAQGLITNFHQPQSSLLLLVASIIGDDWRKVYNYALQNDFRFLSYGDGSLIMKSQNLKSVSQ